MRVAWAALVRYVSPRTADEADPRDFGAGDESKFLVSSTSFVPAKQRKMRKNSALAC